jgi:hypothetical protein
MILDTDKIVSDVEYRDDLRHRFITDHFFAAKVLGFDDFSERAHAPAVALYGPKNPNIPLKDQARKRKILHLDPRHTFKTSLKMVDRVQWICAFSKEITIVNNSETQPLAEAISIGTADYFYNPQGYAQTPLQLMYPELLTRKDPRKSPSEQKWVWNTNNRQRGGAGSMDATLAFTSPKSGATGWHPLIMDYDDVEGPLNSGIGVDDKVRQHVIDVCDQNENLLRDGGFISIGGTRYHPFDWYGKKIESSERDPEDWGILIRGSLRLKDGARLLPGSFPKPDEIELLWPENQFEKVSYKSLRTKFYENYESFMCQQQNDPQGGAVPVFEEKLYVSCLVAPEKIPFVGHTGDVFTCWRMQYGGKRNMVKFAEGAAAKIMDGKVYIIDCWQTTRTPSGLAEMMVQMQKLHQADAMMILDTPGSEFMNTLVRNEAARKNVSVKVQWPYWEEDDNRRDADIKQMEPLMKVGRVMFSTAMTKAPECQKQFVHYGLVEENGIAECVRQLSKHVGMSQMRANMQEEEIEWQRRTRDNAMLNAFMQQQGMPVVDEKARMQVQAHAAAMAKMVNYRGMPPLPGGLDG